KPKGPHGAAGGRAICASYEMELAGMVALGEYSDGCICEVPGKRASVAGASGPAAVAVMGDMANRWEQGTDVAPPAASAGDSLRTEAYIGAAPCRTG